MHLGYEMSNSIIIGLEKILLLSSKDPQSVSTVVSVQYKLVAISQALEEIGDQEKACTGP